MVIAGIDPGSRYTGFVIYDDEKNRVLLAEVHDSEKQFRSPAYYTHQAIKYKVDQVFLEMPKGRGAKTVGEPIIQTAFMTGSFFAYFTISGFDVHLILRFQVVKFLGDWCKSRGETLPRSRGDSWVSSVLLDYVGPKGSKKQPGPCYGVKSHAWAALAVAVTGPMMLRGRKNV